MKNNEIIKGLECMKGVTNNCYSTKVVIEALDLINRQQADKEKLQKNILKYEDIFVKQQTEIKRLEKAVDIYKAIAEDWKYEAKRLKEMVGDK